MEYVLYIASVLGAVALLMMMPTQGLNLRRVGALTGAATLGGLWLCLWPSLSELGDDLGLAWSALPYYYIFSAIAIAAAVRVITHTRPVYAALWFVLTVLASAGLFLTLGAEFMAFGMVIIYGGAILVTYVFVIMLASHMGDAREEQDQPKYDRLAREPMAAIAVGFVLLAVLLDVAFQTHDANPDARALSDQEIIANVLTERPAAALVKGAPGDMAEQANTLTNVERVGLDLFQSHPLGLELAGVILLVSLIGAIVIARQRVDTEDAPPPV